MMHKLTLPSSSYQLSLAVFITFLTLVFNSCNIKHKEVAISFLNKVESYYNTIIPDEFPKLNLKDTQNSVVIWNSPNTYSYLINSDTLYSDPDNDRGEIILDLVSDKSPVIYRFKSSDSIVGYNFVSNDINMKTGKEYFQMNIYDKDFYLSDPNNSELDYLPVLIHELAHMTERSTEEEQLNSSKTNISPFPLISIFETDSIFRSQIIEENELLLMALNSPKEKVSEILSEYFIKQEIRKNAIPDSIISIEPNVEASEGYGRFVEYLCKIDLDSFKLKEITDFEIQVPQYNLTDERYMFDASIGNAYMYVTGFNKIRLLMRFNNMDFLDIYKGKENNSLDPYLKEMIKR